jgi:hypothetical protein
MISPTSLVTLSSVMTADDLEAIADAFERALAKCCHTLTET